MKSSKLSDIGVVTLPVSRALPVLRLHRLALASV